MSGSSRVFWIVVLGSLLLTRIPLAPEYLDGDYINVAFGLERFDPRIHQPQPPGYPFFMGVARIVNVAYHNADRTFRFLAVVLSALCLPFIAAVGRRMFSPRAANVAALLLLVNPVFWYSGLEGPLRLPLTLFSLMVAYCSWRSWHGEKDYVVWGALALGIGSGFRPDLLIFLPPLWFVSAYVGTRSWKWLLVGLVTLSVPVLIWVGVLVYAVGGIRSLFDLNSQYLLVQSRPESIVLGAGSASLPQLTRLVIWNGFAIVGWLWALAFVRSSRTQRETASATTTFFAIWLIPGLLFQVLIHVQNPGHTLFSIPAWCLIGGQVLSSAADRLQKSWTNFRPIWVFVAIALVINATLFVGFKPSPPAVSGTIWDTVRLSAFVTSISELREADEFDRVTMDEIKDFSASRLPAVVVAQDAHEPGLEWALNWRKARYYLPQQNIWVLAEQETPPRAWVARRDKNSNVRTGSLVRIPIPAPARIVWLIERNGRIHQSLQKTVPLRGGQKIFYSDVAGDAAPFEVGSFLFVPTRE